MGQWVGQKIKRTEDPRLVTGTSHYLDDLWLPGLAHAMIVRSLYAHARILSLDTSRALEAPGVLTVLTGNDLEGKIGSVPCAAALPDLKVPHHPVLATGKVRYVGEPVAVVVASDRYAARDAMDLIEVEYEPLDPVIDPEESIQPGAPVLHDRWDNNTAFVFKYDHGDVEKAFSSADKTIRQRIVNQRLIPCAMEPRGVLAQYAPGERLLTLWSSTQIPHLLKTQVAVMLGFPENRLRVITPEVGGGFGSK
ncbi:MAG: xanthine dehydrogenase family protein molybdopterin-binding subunit, partial [Acidobacteria bacterium]|nr:xanthine dehydrogenase family protein molybdopterin-binding subunit [Acidobacteriota bacterium]